MKLINLFHIITGTILLIWLHSNYFTPMTSLLSKSVAILLGIGVMYHHFSKYFDKGAWIYLFHAMIVAPVIIYFGCYPKEGRGMLQLVAVSMIAYHLAIITHILK
jgi:hypothetical protein